MAGIDSRKTVLVVEDDHLVCSYVTKVLEKAGYNILKAHDGVDGLRVALESGRVIDLLLSDVVLPLVDGANLATYLAEASPAMHILLMSGHPPGQLASRGVNLAMMDLLPKPFTPQVLLDRVEQVLAAPIR